jgi:hypothetical protein
MPDSNPSLNLRRIWAHCSINLLGFAMLNVFITVDTEIWCNGWNDLDRKFPEYFKKYVYGVTSQGNYALPGTLDILANYGLPAVFFVEPLFSARFGLDPLAEMVGLIQEKKQEIQLHLHPEWVDEAGNEILSDIPTKLPHMTSCTQEQQTALIAWGLHRLRQAGVSDINAFRAGGFAANRDTLRAVAENKLTFDTSYNLAGYQGVADMAPGESLTQPRFLDGVYEYPVSVIQSRYNQKSRILQITACSYRELVDCLNTAYQMQWDSVVIVTHNFELLSPDKSCVDQQVLHRFSRFCKFLDNSRDRFSVRGFHHLEPVDVQPQPDIISGSRVAEGLRTVEQVIRRVRYR